VNVLGRNEITGRGKNGFTKITDTNTANSVTESVSIKKLKRNIVFIAAHYFSESDFFCSPERLCSGQVNKIDNCNQQNKQFASPIKAYNVGRYGLRNHRRRLRDETR